MALTQKQSLSYYYSLPNKIFQYLRASIPILGSNFPEFEKIIMKEGIGEVISPSNPEKIAFKIKEMTEKPNFQKYHHRLKGLAKKKYNWQNQSQTLVRFYQKILS